MQYDVGCTEIKFLKKVLGKIMWELYKPSGCRRKGCHQIKELKISVDDILHEFKILGFVFGFAFQQRIQNPKHFYRFLPFQKG